MNAPRICTFLAALIFALAPVSARGATDDDIVYASDLPGGRRLVVLRAELPRHEAKKDTQGKPVPEPGVQWPEHNYEYSFVVQSADGATRQVVGKKRMGTMPGEVERMQFGVLEAFVYDDQLVVIYRAGRGTYGDSAFVGASGTGFLMERAAPLVVDARESGSWVIGGRLEGSPKGGDLRAIITEDVRGLTVDRRFLLVEKEGHYRWAMEPASPVKK